MERDTILMLDVQMHRGGILEQGLNSRGLNVFRTSRSREASNLLRVLKPTYLVISLEGEGQEFYQRYVIAGRTSHAHCVLLTDKTDVVGREGDVILSAQLPPSQLVSRIYQLIRDEKTDQTEAAKVDWRRTAGGSPHIDTSTDRMLMESSSATASPNSAREWKGNLAQLDVARLFSILMRRRATGKLLLSHGNETRRIWFLNGVVGTAESNQPMRQLPLLLLQENLIDRRQMEQHVDVISNPRPGERLYELRLLDRSRIELVNRLYVSLTVRSSFAWEDGGFAFLPGAEDLPGQPLQLELPTLLLQGIREGYRSERILRILGSSNRVPQWLSNQINENTLPLNTLDSKILHGIDGSSSLETLWRSLQVEPSLLYTLVYTLMLLGYLSMEDSQPGTKKRAVATPQSPSVAAAQASHVPFGSGAPNTINNKDEFYQQQTPISNPSPQRRPHAPNKSMLFGQETPLPLPKSRSRALSSPQALRQRDDTPVEGAAYKQSSTRPMESFAAPGSRGDLATPSLRAQQQTPTGNPLFSNIPPKAQGATRARPPTMSYRAVMPPARGMAPRTRQPSSEPAAVGSDVSSEHISAQLKAAKDQIEQKYFQSMTEDYFNILEVSNESSELEIRRAYQRIKQSYADGRFSPAVLEKVREQLKEIQQTVQEAYEVLGDPTLRERYSQHVMGG